MFNVVIEYTGSAGILVTAIIIAVIYPHKPGIPWFAVGLVFLFVALGLLRAIYEWLDDRLEAKYGVLWLFYQEDKKKLDNWFVPLRLVCAIIGLCLVAIGFYVAFSAK